MWLGNFLPPSTKGNSNLFCKVSKQLHKEVYFTHYDILYNFSKCWIKWVFTLYWLGLKWDGMGALHRGSKSINDSASGHDLLNRAIFPRLFWRAQKKSWKGDSLRKSPDRKVLKSFLSRARNRTVIFHRRQAGRGITTLGQRLMDDLKDLEA